MIVKLLDGKSLAKATEESISKQVDELNNNGISPTLATILVGQDPASETYVKMKRNTCARVGMKSIAVEMSDSTTTEELLKKIHELNDDDNVHGILLQHPVPHQIDERLCFDAIDIDNWCYLNSIENIKRNNSENINVYEGEVEKLMHFKYDNIFANINLNVLLADIPIYSKMLNRDGVLYLSGFYKKDINSIEKVAEISNLSLVDSKVKNQWVALKFTKIYS